MSIWAQSTIKPRGSYRASFGGPGLRERLLANKDVDLREREAVEAAKQRRGLT